MKTLKIILFILLVPLGILAQHNVIKANLSSVALGTAYVSYEHTLAKKFSLQLGINWLPERGIPFSENFAPFKNNVSPFSEMQMTGFGITPEFRVYTSFDKGSPKGFYVAPYLRYSQYSFARNNYEYRYDDLDIPEQFRTCSMNFSGKTSFLGGGIMIGHQWIIGNHFSIDFFIIGIGITNTDFTLKSSCDKLDSRYFTAESQLAREITDNLKSINSVELKPGENSLETHFTRTLPSLRGFGLNVGVAF